MSPKANKTIVRTHNSFRELRPLKIDSGSDESLLDLRYLYQKKSIFETKSRWLTYTITDNNPTILMMQKCSSVSFLSITIRIEDLIYISPISINTASLEFACYCDYPGKHCQWSSSSWSTSLRMRLQKTCYLAWSFNELTRNGSNVTLFFLLFSNVGFPIVASTSIWVDFLFIMSVVLPSFSSNQNLEKHVDSWEILCGVANTL